MRGAGAGRARPTRRGVVLVAAVSVVALAVVGGLIAVRAGVFGTDGPLRGTPQQPAPALTSDGRSGAIEVRADGGVVIGPDAALEIRPPADATEMQVGLDPTFRSTPWVPVAPEISVELRHAGHQMLYARFRTGPGAEPTDTVPAGVTVDATFEAATASVDGLHRPSWARPISSTSIVVRIETGRLRRGRQLPYTFDRPEHGDRVKGAVGSRVVERNGEPYAEEVAGSTGLILEYDRVLGSDLDVESLTEGTWVVSSDDGGDRGDLRAEVLGVIVRPIGTGQVPSGLRAVPLSIDVVLGLPVPTSPGSTYVVSAPPDLAESVELQLDPSSTISPAVHVNQNGYAPDDDLKIGYLSGLPTDRGGAEYADRLPFSIVDVGSGTVVLTGETSQRPFGDELGRGDLTGAQVFELDFSSLDEPGTYQACVDTVGCSERFVVDSEVWVHLATTIARAMYHQRSGIALGPPFSSVARPRPYHPDDGLTVTQSTLRLLDTLTMEPGAVFGELVDRRTEISVADAWGGHFDAGDWDRRIQHLFFVRTAIELVRLHPDTIGSLELNIPESGDAVPDLLDEGLWSLDLFRRLQRSDGAVRGGIEASAHPQGNASSWTDDLAVFAYAVDPWSTYVYAGVAAQMASVLRSYDPGLAMTYEESAVRAMTWAEGQPSEDDDAEAIREQRSVAAAALFELTGDERWHDAFRRATDLGSGVDAYLSCHQHTRCDAGWIYLGIDPERTDPELRALVEQSFVATADQILLGARSTAFGWAVENQFVPLVWGLGPGGSPSSLGLMRAYEITGDDRYRAATLRSASVTLGANPTNTSFVTGIGRHPVRYPLIVDTMYGGLPVWPGTPVYGNHQVGTLEDDSWVDDVVLEPAGVSPLSADVPYMWQWYDVPTVAMFNEFTVFQSHAHALYAFASLAAS